MNEIAVVIPTYNSSQTIQKALSSLQAQTYQNKISVYVIDDCSKDHTLEIVRDLKKDFFKLEINIMEKARNQGQGHSRNIAIAQLKEPYVIFLDSDDFLEPECLEIALNDIKSKSSDFSYFDWIYYNNNSKRFNYVMNSKIIHVENLYNNYCADFLNLNVYFSTPAIYSTKFLQHNQIKYGEGYYYEDYEFMVLLAMKANHISFIHRPLYVVGINENSTTRSNHNSNKHMISLIKAVQSSLKHLYNRSKHATYYFYRYVIDRAFIYSRLRTPIQYRYQYFIKIVNLLANGPDYTPVVNNLYINRRIFNSDLLKEKNSLKILYIEKRHRMRKISKRNQFKKAFAKVNQEIDPNLILFLGFDYEYKGNSKYLYEILKKLNYKVEFIDDKNIELEKLHQKMSQAKVLIFESWNNTSYPKKEEQVFLQLWHGSPIKKMLFDSNELVFNSKNRKHRKNKYQDYKKWDYLLLDTQEDAKYFDSAFLKNNYAKLNFGYPRVKYLIDNQNNHDLIQSLKHKYQITKPVILYAPTWRDQQFNNETYQKHLLDLKLLQKQYNNYQVISMLHDYLNNNKEIEYETQELILISDVIISDYSSIIYDALAINKEVLFFQNDLREYEIIRGLYQERLEPFKDRIAHNQEQLHYLISNIDSLKPIKYHNNTPYHLLEQNFINFFTEIGVEQNE